MRDRLARLFALHFQPGGPPGGAPGGPTGGAGAGSSTPPAGGSVGSGSAPATGAPAAPGTPPAPSSSSSTPPTPEPTDPDALRAELAEARKEAARYRTDAKRLQDAADAAARERMTEDERKAAELATREQNAAAREASARERILSASIREEAASAGVPPIKLTLVVRLIDPKDVEWTDEGEPKNVKELVASFVKTYPDFTQQPGGQGAGSADGGSGGSGAGAGKLTKADLAKMTPAEINARWPEVAEAMRGG